MAYRGPTVTLLRLGKEGLLIVAIDVEWRLVQVIITIIIIIIIIIIIYYYLLLFIINLFLQSILLVKIKGN